MVAETGTKRRRHVSRREKEKQARKIRIGLLVVGMWLLAVLVVVVLVQAASGERGEVEVIETN